MKEGRGGSATRMIKSRGRERGGMRDKRRIVNEWTERGRRQVHEEYNQRMKEIEKREKYGPKRRVGNTHKKRGINQTEKENKNRRNKMQVHEE